MKTLIINIDKYTENINFNPIYINTDDLINTFIYDKKLKKINNTNIRRIKDFNVKEKDIIDKFVSDYIYLNIIKSKYNKNIYYKIIKLKKKNIISYIPIFRVFWTNIDIIYRANINKKYNNILQIGLLPTFLESYIKYTNNDNIHSTFINIKNYENEVYINLIDKFIKNFNNVNILDVDIFSNNIKNEIKFDLIFSDIYKMIANININNILEEYTFINSSYFDSFLNVKYIFKIIIFALNNLLIGGTFIIFFPGYENKIYDQFIKLLTIFFDKVHIQNSSIDYSYRYYVICSNFQNNNIIKNINNININMDDNIILNNLFITIANNEINLALNKKLKFINKKIKSLQPFFNNSKLINKLYYHKWYNQIYKTYIYLLNIFKNNDKIKEDIHNNIFKYLKKYNNKINYKLENNKAYKYIIKSETTKINIIDKVISNFNLLNIIPSLKYNKLFNLIIFNKKYTYDNYIKLSQKYNKNDLLEIAAYLHIIDINTVNLNNIIAPNVEFIEEFFLNNNDILFIDIEYYINLEKKINIFRLNNNIVIIKFKIDNMFPFLLSLIYIYTKVYSNTFIYYPKEYIGYIYFIGIDKTKYDMSKIISYYNLTCNKVDKNLLIIALTDFFISRMNTIIIKIILKKILQAFRLKFKYNLKIKL
jgi:hypothetical protein